MIGKLGKKPYRHKDKTLVLADYLTALPTIPDELDLSHGVTDFGMLANDRLGCCTISGVGHAVQSWRLSLSGVASPLAIDDATIEHYYSAWDGWNPHNPEATDQGGVELDVLTDWRKNGFAIDGTEHGLEAFAWVNPLRMSQVKAAIYLYGGLYIGLQLPVSIHGQSVWDAVDGPAGTPGSLGGHCVWITGFDKDGLTCITWGALQRMTWDFWDRYCEEAWACISSMDWWGHPEIVNWTQLQQDLQAVTT